MTNNKPFINSEASSDAILPTDPAKIIRNTIKTLDSTAININNDELWASLSKYNGYRSALKPYLEDRIEKCRSMSEIDFDGKESAEEIGVRYLICSGIAKELQDILVKVEMTGRVIEQLKKEKENGILNNY